MFAWLQQYMVYVILGLLIALGVSNGYWAIVVWFKNNTITTQNLQISEQKAQLQLRDTVIEGFAQKTQEVAKKVDEANAKAAASQKSHQKQIEDLVNDKFPVDCQEAADYAVSRTDKILPEGWRE